MPPVPPSATSLPTPGPTSPVLNLLRAKILGVQPVPRRRKAVAMAIAVVADLMQLVLFPVFAEGAWSAADDVLDVVVGLALLVTLGFRPRLAVALAVELLPGFALFPTWTAVVATLPEAPDPSRAAR